MGVQTVFAIIRGEEGLPARRGRASRREGVVPGAGGAALSYDPRSLSADPDGRPCGHRDRHGDHVAGRHRGRRPPSFRRQRRCVPPALRDPDGVPAVAAIVAATSRRSLRRPTPGRERVDDSGGGATGAPMTPRRTTRPGPVASQTPSVAEASSSASRAAMNACRGSVRWPRAGRPRGARPTRTAPPTCSPTQDGSYRVRLERVRESRRRRPPDLGRLRPELAQHADRVVFELVHLGRVVGAVCLLDDDQQVEHRTMPLSTSDASCDSTSPSNLALPAGNSTTR